MNVELITLITLEAVFTLWRTRNAEFRNSSRRQFLRINGWI